MTEQQLILELVTHRVKRFLLREKQETQGVLYARTGRGANPQEFQAILQKLCQEGLVTLQPGRANSMLVSLAEVTCGTNNPNH